MQAFSHKPTTQKANKPFKSRKSTKGDLKSRQKGKSSSSSLQVNHAFDSKLIRKNNAKLLQQSKRTSIATSNRLFLGKSGVSKVCAIVPLCHDVDVHLFCSNLIAANGLDINVNDGPITLNVARFNQKLQLVPLKRNLIDILDAVKVADYVFFIVSAVQQVDHFGDLVISMIKGQGVPTIFSFVQHIESIPEKVQPSIRKSLTTFMEFHFAGEQKLFSADNEQQVWIALRSVTSTRPKPIAWRDRHSYMNGENITWNDDGTLCVTGYIRGRELSANSLVHIQNYGDFQISKITSAVHPLYKTMDVDPTVLAVPDSRQESLVSENEPDMMEGEQTWPTEDEIKEAEDRVKSLAAKPRKIKVPRGFSAYQAAWIATSEDEVSDSGEDDQDHDMDNNNAQDDQQQESEYSESEDDLVEIDAIENETVADTEQELGREEEERQYAEYLSSRKKQKDSAQDLLFPDEMDTPMNIAARVRFQRFRGLKSFRNTPWDAYENLPIDYSRIFQFQNFNKTRSKVFKDLNNLDDDPCVVSSGIYATIHIANVPLEAFTEYSQDSSKPRILFSLLPHEHKMSVASFTITRPSINSIAESLASAAAKNDDMASILGTDSKTEDGISISLPSFKLPDDYIVKSKEQVVMCCGFRRYLIKPIYSIESRGSSNNVNKFVRFLQPGTTSIASCYAPIQFAPTPITLFKMSSSTALPIMIGTGSILPTSPTRIIAKRIILTGHPFKIHKRSATVRYMFHNADDVNWFKPVELFTKHGRRGHIKESLGTHGYMKCLFDVPLQQMDTVCMYLYKRVFPKWDTVLFNDTSKILGEQSCDAIMK